MKFLPASHRPAGRSSRSGVALIIILAFVVLLTGLILAMLSRATFNKIISNADANTERTDLYGHGAIAQIQGDLRQEIAAGSTSTNIITVGITNTFYRPLTFAAGEPATAGPVGTAWTSLPNLIKESARNVAFYPSTYTGIVGTPPTRAAAIATTDSSLNSRSISLARWNKPLLLPKATTTSSTDLTPIGAFTAPDWILSASDGTNPTGFSSSMADPKNTQFVIGRYAYAIYNEGSLLDANVAGGPSVSAMSTSQAQVWRRKGTSAFADLTQLPSLSGLGTTRAQQIVDTLVGWRNYASAQPGGDFPLYTFASSSITNYLNFILGRTTSGMTTGNTSLYAGQSDRIFGGRQQLIAFLQDLAQSTSEQAALQNTMQYLTTFSRSLNQPTYWPDPNRPKVVGGVAVSAPGSGTATYTGGNSAYGSDNIYNPPLPCIRAITSFIRDDGTLAVAGDPLVKKRFALSRLCWITYKGPSANLSATDPLIVQYLAEGVPQELLNEGTPANIQKYFGLTWMDTNGGASSSLGGCWIYNHGISVGGGQVVGSLSSLLNLNPNREPDFFELLQAAINVGSLAKSSGTVGNDPPGVTIPPCVPDSTLTFHILQLGANIIDEANPTQYPTHIEFQYAASDIRSIYGAQDLPYLNALSEIGFITTPASPSPPADGSPVTPAITLSNAGQGILLVVPSIWNPYDVNGPLVTAGLSPTNLRVAIGTPPNSISNFSAVPTPSWLLSSTPWSVSVYYYSSSGNVERGTAKSSWTSESSTALTFSNTSSLYREPTELLCPGIPSGSNLALDPGNVITSTNPSWSTGIPEASSGSKFIGFLVIPPLTLRWTSGTSTYTTNHLQSNSPSPSEGINLRLEYQVGSTWIPYKEYYGLPQNVTMSFPFSEAGTAALPSVFLPNGNSLWNGNTKGGTGGTDVPEQVITWDPRSVRWGLPSEVSTTPFLETSGTPTLNTVQTWRPSTAAGVLNGHTLGSGTGWHKSPANNVEFGRISQNLDQSSLFYYSDADGVVRRAMGGSVAASPSSSVGLPMATVYNNTATNGSNRPVLLHRPYRSVAELGYVFRDTPWKNIDFFNSESGDSALLDVFCINEDYRPDAVTAGRVDLNGKQTAVFNALLAGAYRDEDVLGTPLSPLASTEIANISQALVTRTSGTGTGQGPLFNMGDLVGRYVSTASNANSQPYAGFSDDLNGLYTDQSPSGAVNLIQRFRETTMRALSDAGMAGTWNLLIDVVAQSGRYPTGATGLSDFLVEGERRYWVHVAISRVTGQIIDESIEPVSE